MINNLQLNADRFMGFANVYDTARPKCPEKVKEIILKYLGRTPACVVDLGCGTGLSTNIWSAESDKVVGVEPCIDMLKIAKEKAIKLDNVEFIPAFSDNTGLNDKCADIITCSQSFHWMDPKTTLNEVDRLLKKGGIFSVYDCDWPPVCNWQAELEYQKLFEKVEEITASYPKIKDSSVKFNKERHLSNIIKSEKFRYVREIVFSKYEECIAKRFIDIALSQGGIQTILKSNAEEITPYLIAFQDSILDIFGDNEFTIGFCYRMRIGVK